MTLRANQYYRDDCFIAYVLSFDDHFTYYRGMNINNDKSWWSHRYETYGFKSECDKMVEVYPTFVGLKE